FISDYTQRTYSQFLFNGGGVGPGLAAGIERPSANEFATEASIVRMRDQYLSKVPAGTDPAILQAIRDYFEGTNQELRWLERARAEAEPKHLDELVKFAARAYRRPLTDEDRTDILAYYRELRQKSGLTHEEAMRGSIAAILVSPDFLYRVDLVSGA